MNQIKTKVTPLIWQNGKLSVLDQRLLPFEKKYLLLTSYKEVINAIKSMALRGAPLIGIAASYGMTLAANEFKNLTGEKLINKLNAAGEEIKNSRPTAVNLNWAIDLILSDISILENTNEIISTTEKRALWIHEDDKSRCQKIGENGMLVIQKDANVLTICNTGALATGGIGTAFGIILTSHQKNSNIKVIVAETRPRQQGARLTTFECIENKIDCTLVADTACGHLMKNGGVGIVITGADRIAANGDAANKIGTYQLAVLANENNIPFYIAAPLSTFDLKVKSGDGIPIEERDEKEISYINERLICDEGTKIKNPAFDITPSKYITGIITEKGILKGDYKESIYRAFNDPVVV